MTYIPGKTALVTGAGMGMGRALSLLLAADVSKLVLVDINEQSLAKTADEAKASGAEVFTYSCDISDQAAVDKLKDKVHADAGPVDILVNNAGIVIGGDFLDVPMNMHIKTMQVNAIGVMLMTGAFLPDMVEKQAGHVVQVASASGLMGVAGVSSYTASKHAVVGLTETLRYEMRKKPELSDIHFTTVCPSFVSTGMFEGSKPPFLTSFLTPEQMAQKMYSAIKLNRIMLVEPFLANSTLILKALLPTVIFDWLQGLFGVDSAMEQWQGRK